MCARETLLVAGPGSSDFIRFRFDIPHLPSVHCPVCYSFGTEGTVVFYYGDGRAPTRTSFSALHDDLPPGAIAIGVCTTAVPRGLSVIDARGAPAHAVLDWRAATLAVLCGDGAVADAHETAQFILDLGAHDTPVTLASLAGVAPDSETMEMLGYPPVMTWSAESFDAALAWANSQVPVTQCSIARTLRACAFAALRSIAIL